MLGNTMKERLGVFAITAAFAFTTVFAAITVQMLTEELLKLFARSYYRSVVGMNHAEAWDAVKHQPWTFWTATIIIAAAMSIGLMTALAQKNKSQGLS